MARTGMADIIDDLRGLTEAGTADWTAGTTSYFSDDVLQRILDKYQDEFTYKFMPPEDPALQSDGTYRWSVYEIDAENIEKTTGGTAIFYIQTTGGGTVSASSYTVDYRTGYVTFAPSATNTPYYATGYYYDLNAAAADVWQMKANHAASSFDFTTDNHNIKRSQVYANYMAMARYYRSLSEDGAGGDADMERKDTDSC